MCLPPSSRYQSTVRYTKKSSVAVALQHIPMPCWGNFPPSPGKSKNISFCGRGWGIRSSGTSGVPTILPWPKIVGGRCPCSNGKIVARVNPSGNSWERRKLEIPAITTTITGRIFHTIKPLMPIELLVQLLACAAHEGQPRSIVYLLGVVLNSASRREAKRGQSTNRKGEMSRASHNKQKIVLQISERLSFYPPF